MKCSLQQSVISNHYLFLSKLNQQKAKVKFIIYKLINNISLVNSIKQEAPVNADCYQGYTRCNPSVITAPNILFQN
jgi:hypothetical protein